jgi:large subunit ribosomal protein L18
MTSTFQKHKQRRGKAQSLRNRMRGVTTRPRLSVFRSLGNISAQIIDDLRGETLAAASSLEKEVRTAVKGMRKTDAKKAGVGKVVFDRGAYKYHGRIKALADGAREAGLEF